MQKCLLLSKGRKIAEIVIPNQVEDDFTIGMRLERRLLLQVLSQLHVIIDFSIDGKDEGLVLIGQRLGSTV